MIQNNNVINKLRTNAAKGQTHQSVPLFVSMDMSGRWVSLVVNDVSVPCFVSMNMYGSYQWEPLCLFAGEWFANVAFIVCHPAKNKKISNRYKLFEILYVINIVVHNQITKQS